MSRLLTAALLGLACIGTQAMMAPARAADDACRAGVWLDPAAGTARPHDTVVAAAAARDVVLLGETHDNPEHHRWQLSTLAGLLAERPAMVIGFEAFPTRVQPVLDRWVAGELTAEAFLEQVEWRRVWGYDPELYLPLLHFARQHRIPVVALNVDRAFVGRVGREGWAAIPPAERLGLGDPAPPAEAYLDRLARSYLDHGPRRSGAAPDPASLRGDPAFRRFVDAQLTWDRAIAEALARARGRPGDPLVVGIVGSEHARQRHGVPQQLADLGIADTAVLLPQDRAEGCAALQAGMADAVFVLDPPAAVAASRPKLGVMLGGEAGEVRAVEVVPGSVAEASGLLAGDTILRAAGVPIQESADLVDLVRGMTPGTWLPLVVRRHGQTIETIAKFPAVERSGG
jgi:uncharacterized iron-regulated protein